MSIVTISTKAAAPPDILCLSAQVSVARNQELTVPKGDLGDEHCDPLSLKWLS